MVDFRKWLLAFAAAALMLGLGTSAYAQGATAFVCQATAGNPHIVRAEGVTELVGDLVLNCTGGAPTAYDVPIPLSTVQISLNTNVTSRLTGGGFSDGNVTEALLTVDEPLSVGPGVSGRLYPGYGSRPPIGLRREWHKQLRDPWVWCSAQFRSEWSVQRHCGALQHVPGHRQWWPKSDQLAGCAD